MAKTDLTSALLKQLFEYDPMTGNFYRLVNSRRRPNTKIMAGSITKHGYVAIWVAGYLYTGHRLAWLYHYGEWPECDVDHINGVRSDNSIANLRPATERQNSQNRRAAHDSKTSGLPLGVSVKKGRHLAMPYYAAVTTNGKKAHLGYFPTPEEAHNAYLNAKRSVHPFCTI